MPRKLKKRSTFKRKRGLKGALDRLHRQIAKANRQVQQPGYIK